MKKVNKLFKKSKGFTLIEMLVVVLIIGILAGIALPQYQMAVTKAKVAAILPMMRHIKDSLMEWKLIHGNYCKDEECSYENKSTITDLGIDCPDGWTCNDDGEMENDYWYCFPNEEISGYVYCQHHIGEKSFFIVMYQLDEYLYENVKGMMTCEPETGLEKVCKALGGKLLEGAESQSNCPVYKLN